MVVSRIHMDDALSLQVGADGWSNISDKTLKSKNPIDPIHILNKVRELPVHYWAYKNQEDTLLHLGPFSQDFYQFLAMVILIRSYIVSMQMVFYWQRSKGFTYHLNTLVDTYQISH